MITGGLVAPDPHMIHFFPYRYPFRAYGLIGIQCFSLGIPSRPHSLFRDHS